MQTAATKRPPLLAAPFLRKPVGKNRHANTHARACSNAVKLTAAMRMALNDVKVTKRFYITNII